ncbi:VanW family protein [Leptospira sp. 2 VSF19]|uniref:VanW family protein n=1 Tax=Leptospira soteropolitanensis TaxID=2950025 RepID=A0AAW5VEQ0_9LEPT|nr:VanW family protein [Leptospira soteropolitanensis]MCW7492809.1 VanW family protein [Leptospira soteropolitanensis]MCW7500044.1 VanW family protein [Leptospira soteropolitanensis]MCW7522295.1 VanW family protein [Leptospira soteropolitanensis]MCW7526151.1 VanW family protein [Leptospira soteropolitanensis]MCW7529737.1 VanW family protein [Leptospira soteropolitanensis]
MISLIKRKIKVVQRWFGILMKGGPIRFGLKSSNGNCRIWSEGSKLTLPIFPSPFKEGKLHNLQIAIERMNHRVLYPGKIFSFWYEIGEPTTKKGYKEGRVIRGGQVSSEIAGGLCQLSGIIYYLSLELGLEILERFPHSRDLYNEETRFTPLGTDASIVYPTKDLRIKNTFSFPLHFSWELKESELSFHVRSEKPIKRKKLYFKQTQKNGISNVQVFVDSETDGKPILYSSDDYKL